MKTESASYPEFSDLLGKILTKIDQESDKLTFHTVEGETFILFHSQDCCENVSIEDIEGDLNDLLYSTILQAEEVSDDDDFEENFKFEYQPESHTWTFYKLATIKGYVTIRWLGTSNGYYSESVSFDKL
jgi:hypothetical protein